MQKYAQKVYAAAPYGQAMCVMVDIDHPLHPATVPNAALPHTLWEQTRHFSLISLTVLALSVILPPWVLNAALAFGEVYERAQHTRVC